MRFWSIARVLAASLFVGFVFSVVHLSHRFSVLTELAVPGNMTAVLGFGHW
jgi:hypothetical protein